jgi:hypothetical protein
LIDSWISIGLLAVAAAALIVPTAMRAMGDRRLERLASHED